MVNKLSRETINISLDATGEGDSYSKAIRGVIKAVEVEYNGLADMSLDLYQLNPASTGTGKAIQHILGPISGKGATPADDNAIYYPRAYSEDITGTDLTFDGTHKVPTEFIVHGRLYAYAYSGTGAGDSVKLHVYYEEY